VGRNLADDVRRLTIIREEIGWERKLMVDANQVWDVPQAIAWMRELARFQPWWIEEPTSPDDVLGHAAIARALEPLGIGVATGEHGMNRILFKQLLQARAIAFCQIDSCRLGGVNENLAVLLLAAKFGVARMPARRRGGPMRVCAAPFDGGFHQRERHLGRPRLRVCGPFARALRRALPRAARSLSRAAAARLQHRDARSQSRAEFAYPNGGAWRQ